MRLFINEIALFGDENESKQEKVEKVFFSEVISKVLRKKFKFMMHRYFNVQQQKEVRK